MADFMKASRRVFCQCGIRATRWARRWPAGLKRRKAGAWPGLPGSGPTLRSGARASAQVDDCPAVLRLANTRSGRYERVVEALALDGDRVAVHALADHLVLHRFGATLRQRLVVAIRADRVGVARDHHFHKAVLLGGLHRFGDDPCRFGGQARLVEVEEDDEGLDRWRR